MDTYEGLVVMEVHQLHEDLCPGTLFNQIVDSSSFCHDVDSREFRATWIMVQPRPRRNVAAN